MKKGGKLERKLGKTGIIIALLLMSMALMANVPKVKASGTIYSKADDSVKYEQSRIVSDSSEASELVPILDTFTTVMESGTTTWDSYILTPFILYEGGLYKMWYYAGSSSPSRCVIAYAESNNGTTWINKQVVHDASAWPYLTGSPWVIKEDGTCRMWHMDYYEWVAGDWSGYIAHMTSSDGISWPAFMSADDQKVLSAQGQSTPQGDGYHVCHACVIHETTEYVMWYTVNDHTPDPCWYYKIWRATSTDGIAWTNRQLSLPYVPDTWEQNVGGASVVKEDDGTYTMFYDAWYANQTEEAIGIAKSTDGITWTDRKQFLRASDLGANVTFWVLHPGLIHFEDVDGKRYLYFSYLDKGDEKRKFGRIQLGPPTHDVAVTNVVPSKTVVAEGYSTNINVTVANQGSFTETFNVTVYYNLTDYTPPPGLVGYWKFDEGSGTMAYDSSGYNNHGTLYNGPTWVDGKIGSALNFDGVDDYVSVPDSASLDIAQNVTIEAWIYPRSFGYGPYGPEAFRMIVAKWGNIIYGNASYGLCTFNDKISFSISHNGSDCMYVVGSTSLTTNLLYHVVGVYDGHYLKVYLNGILDATPVYVEPLGIWITDVNVTIGAYKPFNITSGWMSFFDGVIDNVRIYNRALNEREIVANMMHYGKISTQEVTLTSGSSTTLTFSWNTTGFAKGSYTISAYAWPVPGETDTADNTYTDGIVTVTIPGDVNGDFFVNIKDATQIGFYWLQTVPPAPPNVDINGDGIINIKDAAIIGINWLKDP